MNIDRRIRLRKIATLLSLPIALMTAISANADPTSLNYAKKPPVLARSDTPLVMFGLSVDHQLFYKAYSDYADITDDGNLDTDYEDNFDYYGYFDSGWCYEYDTSNGVFKPSTVVAPTSPKTHTCSGSAEWSGNLLNWATMTRMDILRKVLYGGKRTSDVTVSGAGAVLERAYVPHDNHAFAKVIKTNVGAFTPFSSPFTICNLSESPSDPPIFRIAIGEYRRWSIDEGSQCNFGASNAPASASASGKKPDGTATSTTSESLAKSQALANVYVAKCVTGKDAGSASCRQYTDDTDSPPTTYKRPSGLLQEYGDNGDLEFGLISGSYQKNISGGALRKTISLITDEIDEHNGQFKDVNGIIKTLDDIRITSWNGSKHTDCDTHSISIDTFTNSTSTNRKCSNWGNPVGEIYLEAMRYFAGQTVPAFPVTGSDHLGASATWPATAANPLNSENHCADCSIIMLSSGANSFDSDELGNANGIPDLSGADSVYAKTNEVAALEGITGNYVISDHTDSTTTQDEYCSAKSVSPTGTPNLSGVRGICPEVPKLQGGYNIAGLAYHAKTTDLRTQTGMDEDQTVSTYAVELSEALPKFKIGVSSGNYVEFTPACESQAGNNADWLPCSLFDVEILGLEKNENGDPVKGRYIFHWEDSSWGNDYDVDISQVIWFCSGSYCDDAEGNSKAVWDNSVSSGQVRITTGIAYVAAGNNLNVSYTLNGTTDDGLEDDWMEKRHGNQTTFWEGLYNDYPTNPKDDSNYAYPPKTHVYTAGSSTAGNLERPLWYAAKYGGFSDIDGNGKPTVAEDPDNTIEWDLINNRTGDPGADGVPDNYFLASNPSLLQSQLARVFASLVARTSSGTNAAVVSNSSIGVGAVYQALYQPLIRAQGTEASWVGMLQAIFIDSNGYFREDTNQNNRLDDYATGYDDSEGDFLITLRYDYSQKRTMLQRYTYDPATETTSPYDQSVEVDNLKTIWSAVEGLACFPNDNAITQRPYSTLAHTSDCSSGGRHILTWLEGDTRDGLVSHGETLAFTPATFASDNLHRWLDVLNTDAATELVNYIRGYDDTTTGLRNRTLHTDINGYGGIDANDVWRLGDIIHSTPAVVATPDEDYWNAHGDDTYDAFVTRYQHRRQVVYVGANDGMVHAFNGGFWNPAGLSFSTEGKEPGGVANVTAHPLGAEIWAYVPQNLLPHLQWLTEQHYPHVYFVDGGPLVFDANIFTADTDHPYGWGTVMVIGMNFGGGDYPLDLDGDGTDDTTTRSAYVIFDITNPEVAPRVLAEVQSDDLGFTTGTPTLVKNRQPTISEYSDTGENWESPRTNDWYLVFGTGPHGSEALSKGLSDQTAMVKMLDLKTLATTGAIDITEFSTGDTLASVGDLHTADWDRDLADDVVYFGTAAWDGANSKHTGNLKRLKLDYDINLDFDLTSSEVNTFVEADHPIVAAPLSATGGDNTRWVMVGTGRSLADDDNTESSQQYFFSVIEPQEANHTYDYDTAIEADDTYFVDTTDIRIFTDGSIKYTSGADVSVGGTTINSMYDLKNAIKTLPKRGWYVELDTDPDGSTPSGKVTHQATLNPSNRGFMSFTEYVPPGGTCEIDGESFFWELSFEAGISGAFLPLGIDTSVAKNNDGEDASLPKLSIGAGQASRVLYHQGSGNNLVGITNLSTGAIAGTRINVEKPGYGRLSWRQIDTSGLD